MSIKVFNTSVSSSLEIKKNQQRIFDVLTSKKIKFEWIDISQDSKTKDLMRQLAHDPKALPPQICNGNTYCGDFNAFEMAIEEEQLEKFLKL